MSLSRGMTKGKRAGAPVVLESAARIGVGDFVARTRDAALLR
jgi:hypothetical protein